MSYLFRHAGLDALKYYLPLPCSLCAHHTTFEMKSRDCYYQCTVCVVRESLRVSHTHTEHTHSQVTCKSTESLAVCLYCM